MQMKATKLAALFSRLHLAHLALFAAFGLCAAAPQTAQADQWFRFTITGKANYTGGVHDYIQLDEFALVDELGTVVSRGLQQDTSGSELPAADMFKYSGPSVSNPDTSPSNLFTQSTFKYCVPGITSVNPLAEGQRPIFTIHLGPSVAPVAGYNLRSGNDTGTCLGRAPVAWTIETSLDGGATWVVIDTKTVSNDAGLTSNDTWYGGGGSSNDGPTTFYVFQPIEYPLPAGFTRLEYIKSTRQQHILTDYKPNPKTWMQVDCMFSGTWKCSRGTGDGKLPDGCTDMIFGVGAVGVNSCYQMDFSADVGAYNTLWVGVDIDGRWGNVNLTSGSVGGEGSRHQLTVSNGVSYVAVEWTGGVESYNFSQGGNNATKKSTNCEFPLTLFGRNGSDFGSYDMTVWSWKIYESDSGSGYDPSSHLVHNFIPALSPTGVPGLFDSITGEFLSSATATPLEYKEADQWFRFTMKRKWGGATPANNCLEMDELALYTVENVNVAQGLSKSAATGAAIPAGAFNANFTASYNDITTAFDGMHGGSYKFDAAVPDDESDFDFCFTIHLSAGAGEVVKYNLMTGSSIPTHQNRALIAWTMERSYDGVNWELVDERTDERKSGRCPQTAFTWYNNGGTYNTSTGANAVPSNFYWIGEIPLPELLQSEYDYVGYKLVPAVKGAEGLIASGTTAATNAGTYKIVYSLPAGAKWVGGSTAPYELEWSIVSPRPKFLERLAADPRRVDDTPSEYSAYATGGDLVLKDEDLGVFIHVFTNTASASDFVVNQALNNVEILLVGGGGGGGHSEWVKNGGGGGGAGGYQQIALSSLSADTYQVNVGAGGMWRFRYPGIDGHATTFSDGSSVLYTAVGGGHGGATSAGGGYNKSHMPGGDGGCGGGSSSQYSLDATPAAGSQGGDGGLAAGLAGAGGGGAGEDGENGNGDNPGRGGNGVVSTILGYDQCFAGGGAGAAATLQVAPAMGGVGGGGFGVTESLYEAFTTAIKHGENGLGGGGAAGAAITQYNDGDADGSSKEKGERKSAGKGGDGIVIVRYSYNTTANVKVAKPTAKAGLLYNGCTQLAVEEGEGYVLSGRVSADNAGSYTATATLLAGYEWADGSTSALTLSWRIDPAPITGVQLSANEALHTGSPVTQPTVVSLTTANGLTITDANCGWELPVRYERDRQETTDFTSLGYISVVVTGKGNLTGTKAATFRIYDPTKIPLPKPVPASYEYTGSAIAPTFEPAPSAATYTLSGVTSTNQIGVYAVTCTLASGCSWENGSTGPYEVTWEIVKKQTFLEKLASDPRRVNGELQTDFDTGLAQGGDLVLFDPEASAFIHVFTNTAAAATFTARQNLNAELLVVGGGGSGGGCSYSDVGGGGGAGGVKYLQRMLSVGDSEVTVGKGAAGSPNGGKGNNGQGSSFSNNVTAVEVHGGGGGGVGMNGAGSVGASGGGHGANWNGAATEAAGASGIAGEGHAGGKAVRYKQAVAAAGGGGGAGEPGGAPVLLDEGHFKGGAGGAGVFCDVLGFDQYFGGGGGGGSGTQWTDNGAGGAGGGSAGFSGVDSRPGENGLGGGSGGGHATVNSSSYGSGRGGDGIVIIRYMATPPITVPVPTAKTGLFYNGNTQVGVPESYGYTLSGHYATTAGTYTATATLNYGYRWADSEGDDDLTRTVEWTILNYMRLEAIDNGSDPAKAGYVVLTNFHLTGANVVELKYCVNAENNDKWQGMFWSRMTDKSYSLVLRPPNHPVGCKWQVTYGEESVDVSTCNPPVLGNEYVLRLCPTNDVTPGLLANLNGAAVVWEVPPKRAMFGDEALVDTLLFAGGRVEPLVNDEPSRDATGKLTGAALAKMYYFRVENSATDPTPRLDLVPVQDTTTKARGFYDLVSGNFYPLKTPVVLDGNGGEPEKQYVYTSNGEAMPPLPQGTPTRAGFDFAGYALNGWEVKPMTGKDADIVNTGTGLFAYSAGNQTYTMNGVDFKYMLAANATTFATDGKPTMTFSSPIDSSSWNSGTEDKAAGTAYGDMLRSKALIASNVNTLTVGLSGLTQGHTYLIQVVCHEGVNSYEYYGLKVNGVDYECHSKAWGTAAKSGSDPNLRNSTYGRSFVYRFEATSPTHSFDISKYGVFIHINAIQLRDITDAVGSLEYYDENGTPVKDCDFGEGTTLYAQWEPGKYRVINPETGPKIAVDPEWLNGAFGSDVNYQAKLFTTNASGVVAWQAYVLGYEASEVVTAAIVEETAQNADPDTVTIRLRGMPEKPRTNETSRLAYSLLSASTPGGLANGGGSVVTNLDEEAYYKWPKSTFEAPLDDLTDDYPVNYYRIKVHFIFNKSE